MRLFDVNILVNAHRGDAADHEMCAAVLERETGSDRAFGVSEQALSGFLRVVTHPRVFARPTPLPEALAFAMWIWSRPNAVVVRPGPRHWPIFIDLCRAVGAHGNLVPDAYFAALAIEHGAEWVTTDRDYGRFHGLHWRHPADL